MGRKLPDFPKKGTLRSMNDELLTMNPKEIADVKLLRDGLGMVVNLFEQQLTIVDELRAQNIALKNETNRLKGQHPTPEFPAPPKQ